MTDPKIMCRQHLLGEHLEIHMFIGSLNKGVSLQGYVDAGFLDIHNLQTRHDELVAEMKHRGFNHKSPLPAIENKIPEAYLDSIVNKEWSLNQLLGRCSECRKNYEHDKEN